MTNRIRDRGMMAKQDTKEKILAAGAAIIHNKGFNNTGIQEILTAAGFLKDLSTFILRAKRILASSLSIFSRTSFFPNLMNI